MSAAVAYLSLIRPGEPPAEAPRGRAAQDLKWDVDPYHPGYGLTPRRLQAIYRAAECGEWREQCDMFDDQIERDATLRNLFEQREGAIAGKDWSIEPDGAEGESEEAADVLEQALRALPMADNFAHQLGAGRYGAAAAEMDWDARRINGRYWVVPTWFANVPARRFRIDQTTDELLLVTEQNRMGEKLEPGKWWVTRMSGSRVARAGLMRTASIFSLYKGLATRDWVVFSQKFGIPALLVRVPENASADVKGVARQVVQNFGGDGGGVLEEPASGGEIKVEIKETAAHDSSSTHGALITFCNREMSKLINGSTLTSSSEDSGGASYALGSVHESTRWETVQREDARLREGFRTQVSAMFVRFNGLTCRPPRLAIQVVRDMEPKDLIDAAERAVKLKVPVSTSQFRSFTGLYAPVGAADVLGAEPAAAPVPTPAAPPTEVSP